MKNLYVVIIALLFIINAEAQDKTIKEIQGQTNRAFVDDSTHISGWRKGGVGSINIGQGSSRNWAAGAEDFSFSLAASVSLFANQKSGKFSWRNTLDMAYAFLSTATDGVRKADDKIDLYSKAGHDLSKTVSLAFVGNFRTQFYKGFDYDYLANKFFNWRNDEYVIFQPKKKYYNNCRKKILKLWC